MLTNQTVIKATKSNKAAYTEISPEKSASNLYPPSHFLTDYFSLLFINKGQKKYSASKESMHLSTGNLPCSSRSCIKCYCINITSESSVKFLAVSLSTCISYVSNEGAFPIKREYISFKIECENSSVDSAFIFPSEFIENPRKVSILAFLFQLSFHVKMNERERESRGES